VEQIELAMDDPSWSSKNAKETAETTRFFENQKGTAKAYLPCGPPSAPTPAGAHASHAQSYGRPCDLPRSVA
jgi:hypothetical protein